MSGRLPDNLIQFTRTLRAAGMRIGPGEVIEAAQAVMTVGLARRDDFQAALAAVLVKRRQDRELFDEAFHIFWKDPDLLARMLSLSLLLPRLAAPGAEGERGFRRLAEALAGRKGDAIAPGPSREQQEIALDLGWSDRERLRRMDFEKMSADEVRWAVAALAELRLAFPDLPTRRSVVDPAGPRLDLRASLRASLRSGGDMLALRRRRPERRPPPLVVLCDISGSMERYARVFLHFMHVLANDGRRFHGFVFGTRLTNVTRHLHNRDVDLALAEAGRATADWSGGTRIGACLRQFNRAWSRRVLAQGAVVLLMTDGLDHAPEDGLAREMERLHKSCRRLVWLNPLLRWGGFEAKAAGIRVMLPHVDEFRPVHNLVSLEDLVAGLARIPPRRVEPAWRG